MRKGLTNADRLWRNWEQANKEWQNAYKRLWGPRALGGFTMAMTTNPTIRRQMENNIRTAVNKRKNIENKLKNIENSLQGEYFRAINNRRTIQNRLENISKQLNTIPRNRANLRVPLAREFKKLRSQNIPNLSRRIIAMRQGIELRKRILGSPLP